MANEYVVEQISVQVARTGNASLAARVEKISVQVARSRTGTASTGRRRQMIVT